MPGIEINILSIKMPLHPDYSKLKTILTIGSYTQASLYPFKPMFFSSIDSHSILSISITSQEKIIGGVDIPLNILLTKKTNTFKLSDSYNTPDRRKKSPTRGKTEASEITLSIKPVLSNEEKKKIEGNLEKKLEEALNLLDQSYKSRQELQLSIEETTNQLSEMIKNQDNIIKTHLKEKEDLNLMLKDAECQLNLEKNKYFSIISRNQELESMVDA